MRRLLTLLLTVLLAMTVCTINVTAEENQKTLTLDVTYVVENTLPEISGAKDRIHSGGYQHRTECIFLGE